MLNTLQTLYMSWFGFGSGPSVSCYFLFYFDSLSSNIPIHTCVATLPLYPPMFLNPLFASVFCWVSHQAMRFHLTNPFGAFSATHSTKLDNISSLLLYMFQPNTLMSKQFDIKATTTLTLMFWDCRRWRWGTRRELKLFGTSALKGCRWLGGLNQGPSC